MKNILEKTSPLIITIVIGIIIVGLSFGLFGIWLVYLGSTGETEFRLLGQSFKSSNIGIGAIFIGAVIVVMTLKRAFKTIDIGMGHALSELREMNGGINEFLCKNKDEVARRINELLIENKTIWETYGPESEAASQNPVSNAHKTWEARKKETVIPNNDKINSYIESNKSHFSEYELKICSKFKEHAEGFKISSVERKEDVPTFPTEFEGMIQSYVRKK